LFFWVIIRGTGAYGYVLLLVCVIGYLELLGTTKDVINSRALYSNEREHGICATKNMSCSELNKNTIIDSGVCMRILFHCFRLFSVNYEFPM
jgi:hypothetical protein